jgi:5-methylcytosine-specific restriction endonuclease McrA
LRSHRVATDVLAQNKGPQAAVVRILREFRSARTDTIAKAKLSEAWPGAIRRITQVVRNQPVQYLQNIGGVFVPFLYDHPPLAGRMVLKPGVASHLRTFHGLIQQLARSGWIAHVRQNRRNAPIIGQADDLEHFMFGTNRQGLAVATKILRAIQSGECFYCRDPIRAGAEVDHFIPWSKYPRDLAHNFVLAHGKCNLYKSDMLAARRHLDRWQERNLHHGAEIAGTLAAAGFVASQESSVTVARWAYQQAISGEAVGWIRGRETEPIDDTCLQALD